MCGRLSNFFCILGGMAVWLATAGCGFHWVTGEGKIGEVHICDAQNCNKPLLSPQSPVTLRVAVDEAPYGTRITSAWYYIEPPLNRVLLRERITDIDHPQWVLHRLETPPAGYWKEGLYLVEISVGNRIAARVTFRMPPVPPETPPPPESMSAPMKKDILDEDF